jgi:hypothetical protein
MSKEPRMTVLWEGPMDIASVFDWFAQESMNVAEQAKEPKERETLLTLAVMWATAAQQCRGEAPAMQSA